MSSFGAKRKSLLSILTLILASLAITTSSIVQAQAEPTTIIDSAYAKLSQKLGVALHRGGVTTYSWSQSNYPDSSLGCPAPNVTYTAVKTPGYDIIITYKGNSYDYRATLDGSNVFECSTSAFAPSANATSVPGSAAGPTNQPPANGSSLNFTAPLAFLDHNGNIAITQVGSPNPAQITADSQQQLTQQAPFYATSKHYGQIRFSADGYMLAYQDIVSQTGYLILNGSKPFPFPIGQSINFPLAWSQDDKLAFVTQTGQQTADGQAIVQVNAVQPGGAQMEGGAPLAPAIKVGTFSLFLGCGGGPIFDLADLLYINQAASVLDLEWLPKGFLHSTGCGGSGLALTDPSGKNIWNADNFGHVALSPDKTRAAGILRSNNSTSLATLDLNTGAVSLIQDTIGADRVAWTPDGQSLIYSVVTPAQVVSGTAGNAVGAQLFPGQWPFTAQSYKVALWRLPVAGGQATKIFEQPGRAIGNISISQQGYAFSFITSGSTLIDKINGGATADQAVAEIARVQLYYSTWAANAQPALLSDGGEPALGSTAFSVQAAGAANNSAVTPPALVVGQQAVVIVTNSTLNVRATPSRTASVVRVLNPGTIVTIIEGPQQNEGLRWWKITATDTAGGTGWVVDQITDATGTSNTLAPR